jgi:chromosomal replication initiator protein
MNKPRDRGERASLDTAASDDDAWSRICRRLRAELGDDIYLSWFGRLELDGISGQNAYLSVPTKFLKSWIQAHYLDKIFTMIVAEFPEVRRLTLNLRSAPRPSLPRAELEGQRLAGAEWRTAGRQPERIHTGTPTNQGYTSPKAVAGQRLSVEGKAEAITDWTADDIIVGSPLDRRMNFTSFVVGRCNQLAHAAANQIASAAPSDPLPYNPLYLHAAVGLGKTHLLQAVAHAASSSRRRVIYLTAERFMYGFVSALKAQTALAFKEKLRGIDVLVIDDIQFLQGKSIQQEFCHTLNALIDSGRQIVIAADRPPGDLENLDERVRSRLAGGLCVEMGGLDQTLRVKILEARIDAARNVHANFDVPDAVVAYVASVVQTNGRDLDGAVNRLLAHASLNGAPLGLETAETAIRDLVRTSDPKRVKIEDIQKLVASHFNVTRADILSSRRTANVVRPRQIAMYLSKILTLRSLPEIGRRFGGRDHTTVLHAVRKIEAMTVKDAPLSDEIELLKRMLLE